MKRTALLISPFLMLLIGFFAWHTPRGGPLSDAEIEAFMATQPETGGLSLTDTETFEAFLRADDGRPFLMFNLMTLRDVAEYPDEYIGEINQTAAEADQAYGWGVLPLLLARGSYPVAGAARQFTLINSVGEAAENFDKVALVRYRSRRDLIDMLSSEAFLSVEAHKWASLENTLVAPSVKNPAFNFIGFIPLILVTGIGAFLAGTLNGRRAKA